MTATAIPLKSISATFRVLMWGAPFSLPLTGSCISWSHVLQKQNQPFHLNNQEWMTSLEAPPDSWFVLVCFPCVCPPAGARTQGAGAWVHPSVPLGESLCSFSCLQCWGGHCRGGGAEMIGTWGSQQSSLSPRVASTAPVWAAGADPAPPAVPTAGSAC